VALLRASHLIRLRKFVPPTALFLLCLSPSRSQVEKKVKENAAAAAANNLCPKHHFISFRGPESALVLKIVPSRTVNNFLWPYASPDVHLESLQGDILERIQSGANYFKPKYRAFWVKYVI